MCVGEGSKNIPSDYKTLLKKWFSLKFEIKEVYSKTFLHWLNKKTDFLFGANIKGTFSKFPINEFYFKADDEKKSSNENSSLSPRRKLDTGYCLAPFFIGTVKWPVIKNDLFKNRSLINCSVTLWTNKLIVQKYLLILKLVYNPWPYGSPVAIMAL